METLFGGLPHGASERRAVAIRR